MFLGIGVLGAGLVALLRLDRLPLALCTFKRLTGLPCPTCGSTRALARLAHFDVAGALLMNPLFVALASLLLVWGMADLLLLPRGRAVQLEASPLLVRSFGITAVTAILLNWVYLVAMGR